MSPATFVLLQVQLSFCRVKKSGTKLISYQRIFRNGSDWKLFVMENPFLIEFMHLLSFRGLAIIFPTWHFLFLSFFSKVSLVLCCEDLLIFAQHRFDNTSSVGIAGWDLMTQPAIYSVIVYCLNLAFTKCQLVFHICPVKKEKDT